jgi:hypothetical protein
LKCGIFGKIITESNTVTTLILKQNEKQTEKTVYYLLIVSLIRTVFLEK